MSKYTIRILFDVKGWAYHNRALALKKNAPSDFEVTIGPDYGRAFKQKKHNLVFQLAYSYAKPLREHLIKGKYKDIILVSSFNVGWGYANQWLDGTLKYSDLVIINNRDMWQRAGKLKKTVWLSNGVDGDIFKVIKPIEKRKTKVLWVGSTIHKRIKGYDKILLPLSKELKRRNIDHDFKLVNSHGKNRWSPQQMANWYNGGTIYVVTSKAEGTPNPALEAASCGCTIVSTKCGNMPELIVDGKNGYLCDQNLHVILQTILKTKDNQKSLQLNMQKTIQDWHWKVRSKQFFDLFRKLIDEKRDKK